MRTKPRGYWKNQENFLAEARKASEENGGMLPTMQQLQKMGYFGLVHAANSYYGGLNNVKKMLGEKLNKVSNGYWIIWKNLEGELMPIIEELGHFPTQLELGDIGRNDLSIAISRKHGGLLAVRKKLGFSDKEEKPAGYWEDWNNLEEELRPVVDKLGRLPNKRESIDRGLSSAYSAIYNYHGGAAKVRERLGLKELNRRPKGYWKDKKNVFREIKKIMKERKLRTIPGLTELNTWGYKGLATAICEYYGGIMQVRTEMGFDNNKTQGYRVQIKSLLEEYVEK